MSVDQEVRGTRDAEAGTVSRRAFFQGVGTLAAATVAAGAPGRTEAAPALAPLPTLPQGGPENLLLRMQADVQRAMKKPIDQRRWAMAIDVRKCVGCSACTVACAVENKLPPGIFYRPVLEETTGEYPDVRRRFFPRPCMQCHEPPCVPVCPVSSTYKRPDGIVEIDYEGCIGCGLCVVACPYEARSLDNGDFYTDGTPGRQAYEAEASYEYAREWRRDGTSPPVSKARKCHFCIHRLEAGMLPACVATCICNGVYFGDLDDPASVIREFAGKPNVTRLREDFGTKPQVFYLT